ncbi:MAG: DUF3073 domain-containing protein [Mycobacteriales bacterium]
MSRGRAKAKQTKVARELKYSSHEPNFNELQRELAGSRSYDDEPHAQPDDDGYEDDRGAGLR